MILKPTTMAAAGIPPDILHTNDKQVVDSIARNLFSDLTPFVNRDKAAVQTEDFYPVYLNGMKWQNKLLALPDFTGTSVMYFNKKLLDDANVKYPTNDLTWDQWEADARRLLQRFPEGSNTFMIQPFAQDIRHFPLLAWAFGGAMIEGSGIQPPDKTVVKVYSPQNIKSWQRYVDWINKLHVIAKPGETSDWNNEKQAMVMSTRDSVPGFLNRVEWMKDHAGTTLPPNGTSPRRTRSTTRASAIPPNVRNPDASWEVVKYMTGKEGLEITMAGGYTQPVRKSVEEAFRKTLAPFESFQVYMDSQKAYGDGVPYHAQWIELEPIVSQHVQRAVKGEATVDQALKDLQSAMELAMKTAAETFKR
jgi:multiple sugar transport system substrate-binding protein